MNVSLSLLGDDQCNSSKMSGRWIGPSTDIGGCHGVSVRTVGMIDIVQKELYSTCLVACRQYSCLNEELVNDLRASSRVGRIENGWIGGVSIAIGGDSCSLNSDGQRKRHESHIVVEDDLLLAEIRAAWSDGGRDEQWRPRWTGDARWISDCTRLEDDDECRGRATRWNFSFIRKELRLSSFWNLNRKLAQSLEEFKSFHYWIVATRQQSARWRPNWVVTQTGYPDSWIDIWRIYSAHLERMSPHDFEAGLSLTWCMRRTFPVTVIMARKVFRSLELLLMVRISLDRDRTEDGHCSEPFFSIMGKLPDQSHPTTTTSFNLWISIKLDSLFLIRCFSTVSSAAWKIMIEVERSKLHIESKEMQIRWFL